MKISKNLLLLRSMNINEFIFGFREKLIINAGSSLLLPTSSSLRESHKFFKRNKSFCSFDSPKTGLNMASSVFTRIVASCVSIADRSGSIIRDVMKQGTLNIIDKGINDLQTEADRRVQRCILASIHSKFPNVTIIGEEEEKGIDSEWIEAGESAEVFEQSHGITEDFLNIQEEDICLWVDPLDGTNDYTLGFLDHVTVLIGVSIKGRAVAGVLHHPFYNYDKLLECGCRSDSKSRGNGDGVNVGRTIWGIVGLGSFGLHSAHDVDEHHRRLVSTRSHENDLVKKTLKACEATDVIKIGGAGYKVLYMLEGGAEAYVYPNKCTNKWDTCAPEAILVAAGGFITDITGTPIDYSPNSPCANSMGILATRLEQHHSWFVNRVPGEARIALAEDSI